MSPTRTVLPHPMLYPKWNIALSSLPLCRMLRPCAESTGSSAHSPGREPWTAPVVPSLWEPWTAPVVPSLWELWAAPVVPSLWELWAAPVVSSRWEPWTDPSVTSRKLMPQAPGDGVGVLNARESSAVLASCCSRRTCSDPNKPARKSGGL